MRRRLLPVIALLVALLALAAAGLGGLAWHNLNRPFAGWTGDSTTVVLEPGLDAATMLDRLGAAGVLARPGLARTWLALRGGSERLHAGEYRFERPLPPLEVLRKLRDGDVVLHPVTIPEGLTLAGVVERFTEAGFGPREALLAAFGDPTPIRERDPGAADLEGYLFPDTYQFPRGESPARIARVLVERFEEVVGPDYAAAAARVGLDLRQAVTLASMIERETPVPHERRRISRVFHNRLARGMRMECDPTVRYAFERRGQPVERLTYAHLRVASPYNTYQVGGLPPGPIGNPGRESLLAAVDPAPGAELYFVASPIGGHRFSDSLSAHVRAVADWRRHSRSAR